MKYNIALVKENNMKSLTFAFICVCLSVASSITGQDTFSVIYVAVSFVILGLIK